jgi:hypothetical protein
MSALSADTVRGHSPVNSPLKNDPKCHFSQLLQLARALLCSGGKDRTATFKETHMTNLSSKLTAFTVALMMNGLVMGAVGYLFEIQSHPHLSVLAFAKAVATHQWLS